MEENIKQNIVYKAVIGDTITDLLNRMTRLQIVKEDIVSIDISRLMTVYISKN